MRKDQIKILKLFFVTMGATIFIALSLDVVFERFVFPLMGPSSNIQKLDRLIYQENREEIPIFGSSIARRSYIPDSIGPHYFNYGMSGALYNTLHPLLQIECSKNKNTPIIIDFDHHTFFYDEELSLDISTFLPFVKNERIEDYLTAHGHTHWQNQVPGMRYYGSYVNYLRQVAKPLIEKEEMINKGGVFFPVRPQVYEQFRRKRLDMQSKYEALEFKKAQRPNLFTGQETREFDWLDAVLNFKLDPLQVEKFENLLEANRNRLFVLAYSPQNPVKLEGLRNRDECMRFYRELAHRHPNLLALDYSEIGFPEGHYKDNGHMNIVGARQYSQLLKRDLEAVFTSDSLVSLSYIDIRE